MAAREPHKPWGGDEINNLKRWNDQKVPIEEIAIRLGREVTAVQSRLNRIKYGSSNYSTDYEARPLARPELLADRDRRQTLLWSRTDVTANFFGDPPPGYSALDARATASAAPAYNISAVRAAAPIEDPDE